MKQRDAGRTLKAVVARRKAEDGTWEARVRETIPPEEDPEPSPWGWFWAILAGLAVWGALIVLGMCVWYAIKH